MQRSHPSASAVVQHRLYIRTAIGTPHALHPALHQLFSPVTFCYDGSQLSGKLLEAVVWEVGPDRAAELREVQNMLWEAREQHEQIAQEIYMTVANTRGNIWADGATVDSIVTKVLQQKALQVGRSAGMRPSPYHTAGVLLD